MIISIRFIHGRWHWEIYALRDQFASGQNETWKEMIQKMETYISEVEKQNEDKGRGWNNT